MVITEYLLNTLKNFSAINSNLVFEEGRTLKTLSEHKNIIGEAKVDVDIPHRFGIYDMGEFLGVLSMFENPKLEFSDDLKFTKVRDTDSKQYVKYFFSDPENLTHLTRDIKLPEMDLKFRMTSDLFKSIKRAASTLNLNDVVFTKLDGEFVVQVYDTKVSSSNCFTIDIPGVDCSFEEFKFIFNIDNLKILMEGEYDVEVSSRLISKFTNTSKELSYIIALEKSSSFSE